MIVRRIFKFRTLRLIVALSFALEATAQASEVAKFEVEFFDHGSSEVMNYVTVWVSARRVRIEQRRNSDDSAPVLIYRGDLGRFFSVRSRARIYSEFRRHQLTKRALEIKMTRLAIAQQLNALPGDQRRAFEDLLGITQLLPEVVETPTIVTSDNVVEMIAGFECTRATLTRGGVVTGKTCAVPWNKLGLTQVDMEVFRELGNFIREIMEVRGLTPLEFVPIQPLDLLVQFDGFPLYFRHIVDDRARSIIQVKGIEMLPLNESLFEVPENYARRGGHRAFLSHLGLGKPSASPASPAGAPKP